MTATAAATESRINFAKYYENIVIDIARKYAFHRDNFKPYLTINFYQKYTKQFGQKAAFLLDSIIKKFGFDAVIDKIGIEAKLQITRAAMYGYTIRRVKGTIQYDYKCEEIYSYALSAFD